MDVWQPNDDQLTQWNDEGYFILRGVVPCDAAFDMRGVIKNEILKPEPSGLPDKDPMDPMGNSPEAKAYRFRKLGNFCSHSPLIWHSFHTGNFMLSVARYFLGEDIIVKFNSVFVKPAETGKFETNFGYNHTPKKQIVCKALSRPEYHGHDTGLYVTSLIIT